MERRSLPLFINARCDAYFGAQVADAERPSPTVLDRAGAYAESGASGVFVPGLIDLDLLARLSESVDVPVSVMMLPGLPSIEWPCHRPGGPPHQPGRREICLGGRLS